MAFQPFLFSTTTWVPPHTPFYSSPTPPTFFFKLEHSILALPHILYVLYDSHSKLDTMHALLAFYVLFLGQAFTALGRPVHPSELHSRASPTGVLPNGNTFNKATSDPVSVRKISFFVFTPVTDPPHYSGRRRCHLQHIRHGDHGPPTSYRASSGGCSSTPHFV